MRHTNSENSNGMADLSEREKEFFKCLLDGEILKPKALADALSGDPGFCSALDRLGDCVDEESLVSLGLRLNPGFVYIKGMAAAQSLCPELPQDEFFRHGAALLGSVGKTHWVGVVRTFPFDADEIAKLMGGNQAGFTVLTFKEFIECKKKLKKTP